MGAGRFLTGWVLALGLACLLAPAGASARQTFVWQSDNARDWSEAANWVGGEAPAAADGTVNLQFPISACTEADLECPETVNDLPGLTVGELTLEADVVRWTPKEPLELPPSEPRPKAFSIREGKPLKLEEGIDANTTETETGTGVITSGGSGVDVPLELVADNTWSVGPAMGAQLDIGKPVSGPHALTVKLGNDGSLGLNAPVEVGPVSIVGQANSYVYFDAPGGPGDINGEDRAPVSVSGASLRGAGAVGPLTLDSVDLDVGEPGFGGGLIVAGAVTLEGASRASFLMPGPGWGSPSQIVASGAVQLGGTRLYLGEGCPAAGATLALVRAKGGVSGRFTDEGGAPVESGQVFAGPPNGCGPGDPAPALRIDYSPEAVTVTALSPPVSPPTPLPSTTLPAGGASTAGVGVSAYGASAQAALARDLNALLAGRRIGRLLRADGESVLVDAGQAGTLSVTWSTRPRGGRATAVLLARGTLVFRGAGAGHLHLRLTRAGRTLLGHSRRLSVTVTEAFDAPGAQPLTLGGRLELRR